jgi:asparagine synthase (glutamine-hydrolysing)
MCGVLIIVSKKNTLSKDFCLKALDKLKNRGPDKKLFTFFYNQTIFIGNTILSITGNIKNGSNVYSSSDKNIHISFNGEIYNYKEIKKKFFFLKNPNNTDTEILANFLAKTKPLDTLKILNGMYASVALNKKLKKIYFFSDPQGEKRLFKYEDQNHLIISSTPDPIKEFLNKKFFLNDKIFYTYFKTRHFLHVKKSIFLKISYINPGTLYTYDIKTRTTLVKKFDDPISWIKKKEYLKYKKLGLEVSSQLLETKLIETTKLMSTSSRFGCSFSGGVDSSLISFFLKNQKNYIFNICINNIGKDYIAKQIRNFKKIFDFKKFVEIKFNICKYFSMLKPTYLLFKLPLLTHDLVGRNEMFKIFKKKKVRVCYVGDGADELFGGYTMYEKIKWKSTKINNLSPYSSIKNSNMSSDEIYAKKMWLRAYKKYSSFLNKKESGMQASLFTDYFIQCVGVHNISNDILAGENSIEIRSVFLNKNIIKFALNLPIKYKINTTEKDPLLKTKPILKKIFINIFGKQLLLPKIGFSGFPNETKEKLKKSEKKIFSLITDDFNKIGNLNKKIEWKILNLFYFKKFLKQNINIQKYYKSIT